MLNSTPKVRDFYKQEFLSDELSFICNTELSELTGLNCHNVSPHVIAFRGPAMPLN